MKTRLIAALLMSFSANCAAGEERFIEKHISNYPFVASPGRSAAIKANYTKIKNGMTANRVESVLGVPDEVRSLYEPKIKNGKIIGYTYWYVLRRAKESGSMKDKDESVVRVSFDTNGNVTRVDRW